jgi:hypothetical protein
LLLYSSHLALGVFQLAGNLLGFIKHTVYFPKKIDRKYGLNSIKNIEIIKVGEIYCSRQKPQEKCEIVMVGTMPIKVEVT